MITFLSFSSFKSSHILLTFSFKFIASVSQIVIVCIYVGGHTYIFLKITWTAHIILLMCVFRDDHRSHSMGPLHPSTIPKRHNQTTGEGIWWCHRAKISTKALWPFFPYHFSIHSSWGRVQTASFVFFLPGSLVMWALLSCVLLPCK